MAFFVYVSKFEHRKKYVNRDAGPKKRPGKLRGLFKIQGGKCALCGGEMTKELNFPNTATIDHIVPTSRGGSKKIRNLQAACYSCNNRKGNMMPGDAAQ